MEFVPNIRGKGLDKEIDEQEFVSIINNIYKQDCYIYGIIPEWEVELFNELSNDLIIINKFPFPLRVIFPRTVGSLGCVKDSKRHYIYEFYLRSGTMNYLVFSGFDASQLLDNINKKNINIYKIFESNQIPHITIGHDGQWLNIVTY